jgi:hypothetical protein
LVNRFKQLLSTFHLTVKSKKLEKDKFSCTLWRNTLKRHDN